MAWVLGVCGALSLVLKPGVSERCLWCVSGSEETLELLELPLFPSSRFTSFIWCRVAAHRWITEICLTTRAGAVRQPPPLWRSRRRRAGPRGRSCTLPTHPRWGYREMPIRWPGPDVISPKPDWGVGKIRKWVEGEDYGRGWVHQGHPTGHLTVYQSYLSLNVSPHWSGFLWEVKGVASLSL